jgi:serine phosphatase RsbU (regulator of sigma subunit)
MIVGTSVLLALALGVSALLASRSITGLAAEQAAARRAAGELEIRQRGEALVRTVGLATATPFAGSDVSQLRSFAAELARSDHDLAWIAWVDGHSRKVVVLHTGSDPSTAPAEGAVLDDELQRELTAPDAPDLAERRGGGRVDLGGNLRVGGTLVGQLRLAMTTAALEASIAASIAGADARAARAARRHLLVAGIVLAVGIGLALLQAIQIIRPLRALTRQAGAIAGGDFDQRVAVRSRDEIGALAGSFNSMAESLGHLLTQMADKVSLERELEVARGVQESMSPTPALEQVGAFTLAGRCAMATQCGGDWWTYRALPDGRLLVLVGDVTGHGLPAAMIAATARGAALSHTLEAHATLQPQRVLEAMDQAIRDVGRQTLLMTCFAVIIDPRHEVIQYANAGHNFPYVRRSGRDGRPAELSVLPARGNPLGSPVPCITAGERKLHPGDVLLLSTDGLTDRLGVRGERFGDRRLRKLLLAPALDQGVAIDQVRDGVLAEVDSFAAHSPLEDDITLVLIRYDGEAPALARAAG